jgi:alpha-tubulin suppressor-like RCC1 family protein
MKKIFFIGFLSILNATFSQETSECFGITPGQEIEIYENAQVGDTIGIIQYCSTGEWKKVEAEYFNTLALKENGQLYTWGTNGGRWGPLIGGVDPSQAIVFDPHLVKDPLNTDIDFLLDDVSASIRMAFGIKSEDKSLWGWGRDEDGSLGIGEDPDAVYPNYVAHRVPQLLNNTNTWEKVSASSYFGNAIDTEGKLWGWGYADSGYYGNGFQEETYTPTQVGTASDWAELSCGSYNTYLIKDDGTLWVMGPNKKGSSGLGDEENTAVSGIVQIGTDSDWSQVASYNLGALAIKTSGQMFVWGENRGGQLGFNPDTTDIIATPTQIPGTESIVFQHADLGRKHGVASGIDGEFYGWGENLSGQLGNGDIGTYEPFGLIETGTVITKFVSAAGRTSGFITEEGSLRMFGSNDTGQLGYGSGAITNPNTPVVVDLGPNLENKNITKYDSSSKPDTSICFFYDSYACRLGIKDLNPVCIWM